MGKRKLSTYDSETFYGRRVETIDIPGLTVGILTVAGEITAIEDATTSWVTPPEKMSALTFADAQGVKWQIFPGSFSKKGAPGNLVLAHRNKHGQVGQHLQAYAYGNRGGLQELINAIKSHEVYEKDYS